VQLEHTAASSRTHVQQLKNVKSRFFIFKKNIKNVCTVLETSPTEQSLTIQINNYAVFGKAWVKLGELPTELENWLESTLIVLIT